MTRTTKKIARGSSRAPGRSGNRAASYLGTGDGGGSSPQHEPTTASSPSMGDVSPGATFETLASQHLRSAELGLELAKRARDRGDHQQQIDDLGKVFTHCLRAAAYMGHAEEDRRG